MRGISEERLKAILRNQILTPKTQSFVQYLIAECQELQEPWIPIDESTPMNRYLLCVNAVGRKDVLRLDWLGNTWRTQDGLAAPYIPTHYQELPEDPDQGDKNA